jgi:hypothetical protein
MNARVHFSLYDCALDSLHHFEMPIYLPPPERGELRTLLDTAHYVLELPPDVFAKPLWQEAAQAVVGAARHELSLDIAWFAICRALLASGDWSGLGAGDFISGRYSWPDNQKEMRC